MYGLYGLNHHTVEISGGVTEAGRTDERKGKMELLNFWSGSSWVSQQLLIIAIDSLACVLIGRVHFVSNKCFPWSHSNSSRLLLNSSAALELRSSHHRVPKMRLLVALELTRGAGNKFLLDKMYVARIFCKKNGSNRSFLPRMVVQTFYSRL